MKGKTIIQLKDRKTGKLEIIEHKNMSTNALRDIFNINLDGVLLKNNRLIEQMIPIIKKAIGGILLFTDPLEENPDKYYAPSSNPCVGYAGNGTNTTANDMRGSLNLSESKTIDNGYKFVWDFTTNQANGTISSVALTSSMGGRSYMGDSFDSGWHMNVFSYCYNGNGNFTETDRFCKTVDIDVENGIATWIKCTNEFKITKVKKPLLNIDLFYDYGINTYEILNETIIKPNVFKPVIENRWYDAAFFSYQDFYYGFRRNYLNSLQWIKINKKDYSFTEGEWIFKDITFGKMGSYDYYDDCSTHNSCTILNGYLYAISQDNMSMYKINLENRADVKRIDLGIKYNESSIFTFRDYVMNSRFYITSDDRVIIRNENDNYNNYSGIPFFYGPYLIRQYQRYSSRYRSIDLVMPYLATINNLSSPIIKTADKTMKIIYTITQEEENE